MIRTTTVCDICRYELRGDDKPHILMVDKKAHDLCSECHTKIKKLFEGSGRELPESASVYIPTIFNGGVLTYGSGRNLQNSDMHLLNSTSIDAPSPPFQGVLAGLAALQQPQNSQGIFPF